MANFIGVGLGGGGAYTTFAASGCTPLGTVTAPAPITLTLTGAVGVLPCAALLEFTGDDTSFTCFEIEGQDLLTPVEVGSLPLNVRYLSWEQGTAITLRFYPVYVDGTAKSCTITIKDAAGAVVGTETLSATFADPVIGAVTSIGNLLAQWSAQDIAAGAQLADAMVAADISGAAGAKHLYTADANKTIVEKKPTGAGSAYCLTKCIETSVQGAGALVGVDADLAADVQGWWCIVEADNWAALPSGSIRMTPSGSKTVDSAWAASFGLATNKITAVRPNSWGAGNAVTSGSKAYFIAIECQPGAAAVKWYVSDMEGTWADKLEVTQSMGVYTRGRGMMFFGNTNTGDIVRVWPGSSHHTTSPVRADFEAIYEACKA